VTRAAPGIDIQITTEAAGIFDVPAQLEVLSTVKPDAASIAVREIARAPQFARNIYATAQAHNTQVQHIIYGRSCLEQLRDWFDDGTIPAQMRDAILVLGQYAPPRAGEPKDLDGLLVQTRDAQLNMTVCAFGPHEQDCLLASLHFEICHTTDAVKIAPILCMLRGAMDAELFQERLEHTLANGYKGLIARSGQSALGYLGYRITHDMHWGKTFYIDDLVVQPDARSAGIGASLLTAAKAEGAAQRCDHMRLCSGLSRTDAHRFYEKNGFEPVSLQFAHALSNGAF